MGGGGTGIDGRDAVVSVMNGIAESHVFQVLGVTCEWRSSTGV